MAFVFRRFCPTSFQLHRVLLARPFDGIRTNVLSTVPANKTIDSNQLVTSTDAEEVDILVKRLEVEVRGHDNQVLESYHWFATKAAHHLGITMTRTWEPKVYRIRRNVKKSVFANGKHIVQYEFRTYFRVMEFKYLTGSTVDTYLEYIQRNLPEGVAMKVTKEQLETLPEHLKPPEIKV